MKRSVLLATAALLGTATCSFAASPLPDTAIIQHLQDGNVSEWPAEKFTTDKETGLLYAVDNDDKNLYIALIIPDIRTQMKMMRMGMTLFVDPKGKKREGKGIEFPVKRSADGGGMGGGNFQRGNGGGGQGRGDMRAMRTALAAQQLTFLKAFGFNGDDPVILTTGAEDGVQVAYKCDTAQDMHIEYTIPLSLLGDAASLKQKVFGIGCKINGMEMPSSGGAGSSDMSGGGMGGGRGGGMRSGGGGGMRSGGSAPSAADREQMMNEQKFWTKYTMN